LRCSRTSRQTCFLAAPICTSGNTGVRITGYVVEQTKRATIAEYADLAVELKQIGYNLRVLHHR
jgi:hypothetical protein